MINVKQVLFAATFCASCVPNVSAQTKVQLIVNGDPLKDSVVNCEANSFQVQIGLDAKLREYQLLSIEIRYNVMEKPTKFGSVSLLAKKVEVTKTLAFLDIDMMSNVQEYYNESDTSTISLGVFDQAGEEACDFYEQSWYAIKDLRSYMCRPNYYDFTVVLNGRKDTGLKKYEDDGHGNIVERIQYSAPVELGRSRTFNQNERRK